MGGKKFPTIKASVLCAKFQSNNDCRLGLTNCPCVIATIIRVLNYLFVHIAVRLVCVRVCSKPAEQSFLVILALLLFYMRCVYVKACSVRTKSNEQHQQDNVVTSSISLHLCLIWTSSAEAFFFQSHWGRMSRSTANAPPGKSSEAA